jgi:putative transposase
MPRRARIVIPEAAHHVVARGVNGCRIFRSGYDKVRYLKLFARLAIEHGIDVHAYCLMDSHVHFLLTPKNPECLGKFFQRLHTRWAMYFNRVTGRTVHLFGSRYYSAPVDENHYWSALRYIELNPHRAAFREKAHSLWEFLLSPRASDGQAGSVSSAQHGSDKASPVGRERLAGISGRSRLGT